MFWTIVLLFTGFAVLIKGADFLVNGASSLAKKMNISNLAIGLTVVAFGTSAPELIVSLLSAYNGAADASFGNAIGSNNFNLFFILGIAGLIYPLVVQRSTIKYEVPLSILAAVVLFVLVNDSMIWGSENDMLSRTDALILLGFFGLFMFYIVRTMKNNTDLDQTNVKIYKNWLAIVMSVAGLVMLVGGGKLVVDNAILIAKDFGMSNKLIGLTILAAGTSLPELVTSCVAAYRKNTDIAIGNVIGSNIFNIFFILGITGTVSPLQYTSVLNFDIAVLIGGTILLMVFMFTINTRKLDRWEALILFLGYITYTAYLVGMD
ncbi:sodium:proton exchanger [Chryseotalea sanaruensis]|uniref:Sodium:proton exchanger n=1 Tax=Chryseotalea sanaruensis TaxID=2482724 RepID=A0A401U910_9BACT|nr:calcium/sodium antiporter [Chryseotalea sanaruensis]GCC51388.1 sodium:proton exchanger [Chryseotalea sanaruensis]